MNNDGEYSNLHQFKNKHLGETAILFGPGSSALTFVDTYGNSVIRCGINGSIFEPTIQNKLDYYIWGGDIEHPYNPLNRKDILTIETQKLLPEKTIKLCCSWTDNKLYWLMNTQLPTQILPDDATKLGFIIYNQIRGIEWRLDFSDPTSGPSSYSTCFHGVQILMFMGFKNIYLVGFDCGGESLHTKEIFSTSSIHQPLVDRWISFRNWAARQYPNINIFVSNPIGLKNVFKELKSTILDTNNKHFDYIHNICYWIGSNRVDNLLYAINKIKSLQLRNTLVLITIKYDTETYREYFDSLKKHKADNCIIDIIYCFNSGGTVSSLLETYHYIKNNAITCDLLATFEDDFCIKDCTTLTKAMELLNKGYIFVGSNWYDTDKTIYKDEYIMGNEPDTCIHSLHNIDMINNSHGRNCILKNKHIHENGNDEYINPNLPCWTEDPYITTMDNLEKIYDKLNGKFTLAPPNERHIYREHGILYGEVGFCTRLHIKGFKFTGLLFRNSNKYFEFLNVSNECPR